MLVTYDKKKTVIDTIENGSMGQFKQNFILLLICLNIDIYRQVRFFIYIIDSTSYLIFFFAVMFFLSFIDIYNFFRPIRKKIVRVHAFMKLCMPSISNVRCLSKFTWDK